MKTSDLDCDGSDAEPGRAPAQSRAAPAPPGDVCKAEDSLK